MRETKFRAWDGKKMWRIDTLRLPGSPGFISTYGLEPQAVFDCQDTEGNIFRGMSPETPIMQYTGLKDKNGVEIYEGDLVADKTFTYIVKWVGSGLVMWITDQEWRFIDYDDEVLIVGNIYENPELLK